MHELSIASAVVDRVLEFLEANEPKKLLTVRLAVGELSHVEADQLHFCYTAITQETAMENSTLEIETVAAVVRCHAVPTADVQNIGQTRSVPHRSQRLSALSVEVPWNR
jgi:hydrogenase nickel insertion protein HypA